MFRSIAITLTLCFATVTAQAAPLLYEYSGLHGRAYAASVSCDSQGFLETVVSPDHVSFYASSTKNGSCGVGNVYTSQIAAERSSLSDTGFSMSGSAGATSDGSIPADSTYHYQPRADGYNYTMFSVTEEATAEIAAAWTGTTVGNGPFLSWAEFTKFDIGLWRAPDSGPFYLRDELNLLNGRIDDSLATSAQSTRLALAPGMYLLRVDIAVGTADRLGSADASYVVSLATVPTPPAVLLFGSALGLMGAMRRTVAHS